MQLIFPTRWYYWKNHIKRVQNGEKEIIIMLRYYLYDIKTQKHFNETA